MNAPDYDTPQTESNSNSWRSPPHHSYVARDVAPRPQPCVLSLLSGRLLWLEKASDSIKTYPRDSRMLMEGMDIDLDPELMQKFSCMGTTDKDVLISEFQRLLGFQLNPAGCAFFLDMTNWWVRGLGRGLLLN